MTLKTTPRAADALLLPKSKIIDATALLANITAELTSDITAREGRAIAVRHTADAARTLHTLSASLHETVARFKT